MEFTRENILLLWTIYAVGAFYTALILPGLAYRVLLRRTGGRHRLVIVMGIMSVIWVVLNVYRDRTFLLRMLHQEMIDPENTNDGQAGDVLLLMFGWVSPVISIVLFDLVAWICGKLRFRSVNAARI